MMCLCLPPYLHLREEEVGEREGGGERAGGGLGGGEERVWGGWTERERTGKDG